ncbi:hypothetical protein Pmar_PMAR018875 [Perkinsus marinus ATCC 50983]|uniref:Uncharacterized protein n=1 Tax=Perkinsus marinus (strain ATCC 50983 / TXsc) TaxID=423536 RepID=C5M007_PERM5|nr:hypothetical protein Pmar_PMAR018875 [Perkinsus marinus ATCC 50983]EEQ97684.1 hypothetical protein Pmar_PMAR018875 [Perkinsus marinus ATCC 50983]|eukprot:XP_002764967.1 hypothetical protein Pmar_PMAR018875 [Perkinsus marinus ATCC 50983]
MIFDQHTVTTGSCFSDDWPIPSCCSDSTISVSEQEGAFKIKPTVACMPRQSDMHTSNAGAFVLVQGVVVGVDHHVLPKSVAPYLRITRQGFVPLQILPPDVTVDHKFLDKLVDVSKSCGLTIKEASPLSCPRLVYPKLGNRGRAQLRGMIAAAARGYSQEWKLSRGIGGLKTARVKDLIRMADVLGLSEYIDAIALS